MSTQLVFERSATKPGTWVCYSDRGCFLVKRDGKRWCARKDHLDIWTSPVHRTRQAAAEHFYANRLPKVVLEV